MHFIDVLNALLENRRVSRNKFCKDLGIGKNSVANWEGRGNTPDGEVLDRIAEYFGVTVDCLLGRTHDLETELITADPDKVKVYYYDKNQKKAVPETERPKLTEMQRKRNELHELIATVPDNKLEKVITLLQVAIDVTK